MRKLFRNTKGAVTVFVTLLLVPSILVSGTAVDLARMHSARSIIQDANQLAANTVLTQYNSLLNDLYGLIGVANDDPILGELLDDYIKVSVFGEDLQDRELGTFQVFYGSDLSVADIGFVSGQNLREEDVLRRQIEEYMKFRGPVVIVQEFLDAFKDNKIKQDAETINDKLAIDSGIAGLHNKYKELYNAIIAADKIMHISEGISGGAFGSVSSTLTYIRNNFVTLKSIYAEWKSARKSADESVCDEIAVAYYEILRSIRAYIVGGTTYSGYSQGINKTIENAKTKADDFKPKFDAVVSIAREIDAMNGELNQKVDELERKINNNDCSEELRMGLMEKSGIPPMSTIERYRDILKWKNIEGMATAYKNGGYRYIDNEVKPMLDGVRYRNSANAEAGSLSRDELANLIANPAFHLSDDVPASRSMVAVFAGFPSDNVTYGMPPGFLKFAEHPGDNGPFFRALTAMVNQPTLTPVKLYDGQKDEGGSSAEKKQQNLIDSLLKLIEEAYTGLSNNPLGARYIKNSSTPAPERMDILEILTLIPQAFANPVIQVVQDPLGSIKKSGDYLLLLTYSTSMFSNYATTRPESIGKSRAELNESDFTDSLSGVPISPEVNYFFQSEWEYLYYGELSAAANLNAVTRLLFLVRLVCNYITVYSVTEVTTVVTSIQTAFAWNPPLALFLGELARAAFVAAESLVDVAALRSGHKAPLIKNAARDEWVCSPKGIMSAVAKIMSGESKGETKKEEEKGLSYADYMRLMFLSKAVLNPGGAHDTVVEFATRTGNLIEWNIINYMSDAGADEVKMAVALTNDDVFKLADMQTDFSITTTADLRMLFLSLPIARNYSAQNGIAIPGTIPITVTDHRGY